MSRVHVFSPTLVFFSERAHSNLGAKGLGRVYVEAMSVVGDGGGGLVWLGVMSMPVEGSGSWSWATVQLWPFAGMLFVVIVQGWISLKVTLLNSTPPCTPPTSFISVVG